MKDIFIIVLYIAFVIAVVFVVGIKLNKHETIDYDYVKVFIIKDPDELQKYQKALKVRERNDRFSICVCAVLMVFAFILAPLCYFTLIEPHMDYAKEKQLARLREIEDEIALRDYYKENIIIYEIYDKNNVIEKEYKRNSLDSITYLKTIHMRKCYLNKTGRNLINFEVRYSNYIDTITPKAILYKPEEIFSPIKGSSFFPEKIPSFKNFSVYKESKRLDVSYYIDFADNINLYQFNIVSAKE